MTPDAHGQGSDSPGISALAVLVIPIVDRIQPAHMKPWQVVGGVPLHVAGVAIFFRIERWGRRRRSAGLPVDISGGSRFALLLAALALRYVGDVDTHGHAGWLAYAAIIPGSMSDGAWISLVAARRQIGFRRAWHEFVRTHRETQKHCRDVLIGRDQPSPTERPGEASIPTSNPPRPTGPGRSKRAEARQPSRGDPP